MGCQPGVNSPISLAYLEFVGSTRGIQAKSAAGTARNATLSLHSEAALPRKCSLCGHPVIARTEMQAATKAGVSPAALVVETELW
jgi:hypothetical protein